MALDEDDLRNILIVLAGVLVIVILVVCLCCLLKRRKKQESRLRRELKQKPLHDLSNANINGGTVSASQTSTKTTTTLETSREASWKKKKVLKPGRNHANSNTTKVSAEPVSESYQQTNTQLEHHVQNNNHNQHHTTSNSNAANEKHQQHQNGINHSSNFLHNDSQRFVQTIQNESNLPSTNMESIMQQDPSNEVRKLQNNANNKYDDFSNQVRSVPVVGSKFNEAFDGQELKEMPQNVENIATRKMEDIGLKNVINVRDDQECINSDKNSNTLTNLSQTATSVQHPQHLHKQDSIFSNHSDQNSTDTLPSWQPSVYF